MITTSIILFIIGVLILLFCKTSEAIWDIIGFALIILGYLLLIEAYYYK